MYDTAKIAKTNSAVKLSVSLPLSDPQIYQCILGLPQRTSFFLLCVFSKLLGSRLGKRPRTTHHSHPHPYPLKEQPCLELPVSQEKVLLVPSVQLISSPKDTPFPRISCSQNGSPNLIIDVLHQVERFCPMAYWHLTCDLSSLPLTCK